MTLNVQGNFSRPQYNDIATLKLANIKDGNIVETSESIVGKGGAAKYLIKTLADFGTTPDGQFNFSIANTNVAVLLVDGKKIYGEQVGLYPDVGVDQTTLVQSTCVQAKALYDQATLVLSYNTEFTATSLTFSLFDNVWIEVITGQDGDVRRIFSNGGNPGGNNFETVYDIGFNTGITFDIHNDYDVTTGAGQVKSFRVSPLSIRFNGADGWQGAADIDAKSEKHYTMYSTGTSKQLINQHTSGETRYGQRSINDFSVPIARHEFGGNVIITQDDDQTGFLTLALLQKGALSDVATVTSRKSFALQIDGTLEINNTANTKTIWRLNDSGGVAASRFISILSTGASSIVQGNSGELLTNGNGFSTVTLPPATVGTQFEFRY